MIRNQICKYLKKIKTEFANISSHETGSTSLEKKVKAPTGLSSSPPAATSFTGTGRSNARGEGSLKLMLSGRPCNGKTATLVPWNKNVLS